MDSQNANIKTYTTHIARGDKKNMPDREARETPIAAHIGTYALPGPTTAQSRPRVRYGLNDDARTSYVADHDGTSWRRVLLL